MRRTKDGEKYKEQRRGTVWSRPLARSPARPPARPPARSLARARMDDHDADVEGRGGGRWRSERERERSLEDNDGGGGDDDGVDGFFGGKVPEILRTWHRCFGGRARRCESCGISFTVTGSVGLGGCYIHEEEAGPDGTHPCCGFNPYRQCRPSTGWGGRVDFGHTDRRRGNHGNSIGCLADHHSPELRKGSRSSWLSVVPEALLLHRAASARLAIGARVDPKGSPAARDLLRSTDATNFFVVDGCRGRRDAEGRGAAGIIGGYRSSYHRNGLSYGGH
jgi:hypothetical protein